MDAQPVTNSAPVAQGGATGATVFRLQSLSAKLAQLVATQQPLTGPDIAQALADVNQSAIEIMLTLMGPTPGQQYVTALAVQLLAANAQADKDTQALMNETDAKLDAARAAFPFFRKMQDVTAAPAPAATQPAAPANPNLNAKENV